jgi:YVTN family beta-propeller protein
VVVVSGDDTHARQHLRYCILGPLQVLRDGAPVSLGGAQQRAVLAFLLVERDRAVSVEQIADALWGETPPAGYAATIQAYVFRLREVLEPGRGKGAPPSVLVTEPGGYRLVIDSAALDVTDFERLLESGEAFIARGLPAEGAADLQRALSLWRASGLADLADYDFVAQLGRRLDELRLRAVESRIDAELALGHHTALIAELSSLVEAYPLREHLQAQRMLALYRAGRQADALDAFREVRARMMRELGIEPSAELAALHQSILNQDAGLLLEHPAPAALRRKAEQAHEPTARPPIHATRKQVVAIASVIVVVLAAAVVYAVRHSRSSRFPADSVVRIDANGSFHDAVGVGVSPDGVALAGDAIWVANTSGDTVSKIDLTSHHIVQKTPVGSAPQALAVSGTDLWVVNSGAATVSRVSLKSEQEEETVDVGNLPGAIAVGKSGVWVANTGDGTVQRIDPATGRADKPIPVGLRPAGIAVDSDTVWVANSGDGTVSPIDAKSQIAGPSIAVGAGPAGVIASNGGVWVANSLSQSVSHIDPRTRQVKGLTRVGDGPQSIAFVGNRLWVSNEFDSTMTMINPATDRVVKKISTGASVRGLISDGTSAYATTRSTATPGHRGGTLRLTTNFLPSDSGSGIDPSNADASARFEAYSLVYDGLVGLQRTGGAAGLTLVPDLARDLPQPSADGLTYVFTLRRGIHYSNGAEVKGDDIRRGLQQELTVSGDNPGRLANIVGAPACIRTKIECDLSKGVEVDNDNSRIAIHLSRPDPDFLYKLTEPAFATPEGEPGVPAITPRPATGPYMIGEYGDDRRFTLVRNPHFRHPWSVAAQPEGYPDEIEWTLEDDASLAVHNVRAGVTDADERAAEASDYPVLQKTDPDRFTSDFTARPLYLFLNTHLPPFDNADVRKAINLAVDRGTLVELLGGTKSAAPDCQILPPNLPGHRPYCPYTVNPGPDGGYHGPDFRRAAAMVDRSGTRGMTVTVSSGFPFDPTTLAGKYVVRVLSRLGYKAHFGVDARDEYYSRTNPAQLGVMIYFTDYPASSNFFEPLRCGANAPGTYCNPAAERLFDRALQTQRTDPVRAGRFWAALDRTLTDDAPWLVLANLKSNVVLSDRVGNYLSNPKYGPLFGQMWVK